MSVLGSMLRPHGHQRSVRGLDGSAGDRSDIELGLRTALVTIDPRPGKVRAWVRFGAVPLHVTADACRWTADAVGIRFVAEGTEYRCWVWRGAVARVEPRE